MRNAIGFNSAIAAALAMVATATFAVPSARAARVDNIYYSDGSSSWQTISVLPETQTAVDITSYDNFNEFVTIGPEGMRDYYYSGGWTYAQMVNTSDYVRVTDGGAAAKFYAIGSDGRIDEIAYSGGYVTSTLSIPTTLGNPRAIEAYGNNNNEFVLVSDDGTRDYFYNGSNWTYVQMSNNTDYVAIANNGATQGTFFALGIDGRVDRLSTTDGLIFTLTNILAPGTLTSPRDIESYDSNNEFVTVSAQGVREHYFSGGNWLVDQMSNSSDYWAIADNGGATRDYYVLGNVVPEPSVAGLMTLGIAALGRRRRK